MVLTKNNLSSVQDDNFHDAILESASYHAATGDATLVCEDVYNANRITVRCFGVASFPSALADAAGEELNCLVIEAQKSGWTVSVTPVPAEDEFLIPCETIEYTKSEAPIRYGYLISALSRFGPEEDRRRAVTLARTRNPDLKELILPEGRSDSWQACAEILCDREDDDLIPFAGELLKWLKNCETPGYRTVFERLRRIPPQKIRGALLESMLLARKNRDRQWLDHLRLLLSEKPSGN